MQGWMDGWMLQCFEEIDQTLTQSRSRHVLPV